MTKAKLATFTITLTQQQQRSHWLSRAKQRLLSCVQINNKNKSNGKHHHQQQQQRQQQQQQQPKQTNKQTINYCGQELPE